ncbi:MAG: cyclic pyranopterin monophosphate synthase MoaC [bacterium]
MEPEPKFSHIDEQGRATMVDVGAKPVSAREARAEGYILLRPETVAAIRGGTVPKGDVLAAARVAAILAAKRTGEWIPLCHTLPLDTVAVEFTLGEDRIRIEASAKCTAKTGVEMEALTAVSAAALTLYDMCKAVDQTMRIDGIRLLRKDKQPI